ncbi:MAG: hypothetical protein HC890_17150 [Chloroflexaceae bacterium]|nr:hypothetical protein [Chloroflexaceae bacterium]
MGPKLWNPPVNLSIAEKIANKLRKAKLLRFLREIRHLLFDEEFQEELGQLYAPSDKEHPPVAPAQ